MLVTDIGNTYVGDKFELLVTEENSPKISNSTPLQNHQHIGVVNIIDAGWSFSQ